MYNKKICIKGVHKNRKSIYFDATTNCRNQYPVLVMCITVTSAVKSRYLRFILRKVTTSLT